MTSTAKLNTKIANNIELTVPFFASATSKIPSAFTPKASASK